MYEIKSILPSSFFSPLVLVSQNNVWISDEEFLKLMDLVKAVYMNSCDMKGFSYFQFLISCVQFLETVWIYHPFGFSIQKKQKKRKECKFYRNLFFLQLIINAVHTSSSRFLHRGFLQTGQFSRCFNHWSMQCKWKMWLHSGKDLHVSPSMKSSKQMAQSVFEVISVSPFL